MRIFAVLMSAVRHRDGLVPSSLAIYREDGNDERMVLEWARQECQTRFPRSDGYVNHQVAVSEVPRAWIEEAAKLPYEEIVTVDADVWDVEIGNLD